MIRLKHRSFFLTVITGIYVLLFATIGPCAKSRTQSELTFLLGWADQLPRFYNPGYQSAEQARRIASKAETKLRDDLAALQDRITFQLPEDMRVPASNPYPIMEYRILREKYRDRILGRLSDQLVADVPFPREATGNLSVKQIEQFLTQIHLLEMLVNTMQGFSFTDIRLSDAKPSRNQRVTCELVAEATEYTFSFDFTSSLEETLRWVDRLRSEAGFFYINRMDIEPDPKQPGAVEVNSQVTAVSIRQREVLNFSRARVER